MVNKVKTLRPFCGEFRPKLSACLNSLDLCNMLGLVNSKGLEPSYLKKSHILLEGLFVELLVKA